MEKFFEKVARLGTGLKLGVLVGAVAFVFVVFYFGFLGGTSARNAEKVEGAKLQEAKRGFDRAKTEKEEERTTCEQLDRDLKKAKKKMKKFDGKLPEDASVSELIKEVKSKLSGLTFVEYLKQPEEEEKTISRIPLDVKLAGPFHKLVQFLHEISLLSRIVNVSEVSLFDSRPQDGKMELKINLRVTTFRSLRKAGAKSKEAGAQRPGKKAS
jgi:type IV pilus assembly protein PilO